MVGAAPAWVLLLVPSGKPGDSGAHGPSGLGSVMAQASLTGCLRIQIRPLGPSFQAALQKLDFKECFRKLYGSLA